MPYTTPTSVSAGQIATAVQLNSYRTALEAVAKPPQIQAYNTVSQSIPNNTTTGLTLQATYSIRDLTMTGSTVTVSEAGLYEVVANVTWALNGTGLRYVAIMVNAAVSREDHTMPNASFVTGQNFPYMVTLGAGVTVSAQVYQNSGAALDVNLGSRLSLCMLSR